MKTKNIVIAIVYGFFLIAFVSLLTAAALSYALKDSRKPLTEEQRNVKIHSCLISGKSFTSKFNSNRELVEINCK